MDEMCCNIVERIEKSGTVFYKYKGDLYPEYLNRGNAVSFIIEKAEQYCRGNGIDVGAGLWPLPGAIAIQEDSPQNAYRLDGFADGGLDYVFSSHSLEHLDKWGDALELWIRKLKVNGILFLYLPHESMRMWEPGGPWVGDAHKWAPTWDIIRDFLISKELQIIEYNGGRDAFWSFHIVAKKVVDGRIK